ncbi:MAG: alpha/beta fold hydrolase [Paraperlucidibaca sp.]
MSERAAENHNGHSGHGAEDLSLKSRDGYALMAQAYWPSGKCTGRLIIAGATAVPQGFYMRFARYAASRGLAVLTLDYRGLGRSAPADLRTLDMDYRDWARYDLATAIDAWHDPSLPLYWVGHSYGGHALGMLPNHELLSAAYTVASGAGWHGYMPWLESLKVRLLWQVIAPVAVAVLGYMPSKKLGMGENLPRGVYRQWRRWCSSPQYFFDDPELPEQPALFARLTLPVMAAVASDDLWAQPASRDAFFAYFTHAKVSKKTLIPADYGVSEIGHMGYFAHRQARCGRR